jgi:hypothetical protein
MRAPSFGRSAARAAFRLSLALLLSAAIPSVVAAQNVAAWFAAPANHAAYGALAAETQQLAAALVQASLSDSLIAERLVEAAKKRVAPATLAATLCEDTQRYLAVAASLRGLSLLPSDPKKASAAVDQAALLLRAGISESVLRATLAAAAGKLGANQATIDRALAALSVVAAIEAEYRLSEAEVLALATGLVDCDLSNGKLSSLTAAIKSAVKKGLPLLQAIDDSLAKVTKGKSSNADKENEKKAKEKETGKGNGSKKGLNE